MSNLTNQNPFIVDTTGALCGNDVMVHAVTYEITSGQPIYLVILKDKNGKIVYKSSNNTKGSLNVFPFFSQGLYLDTLTNVEEVSIYLAP